MTQNISNTADSELSPEQQRQLQLEILQQTATPALFAITASKGKWLPARHLMYLDRAITDTITATDGCRRLLVSMPPRHGKSEEISKFLPAWYLGTYPDRRVMLASYESDFAKDWGRKARGVLRENGWMFGVRVSDEASAASHWGIHGHDGGMQTAGTGGAFTGKGAHLLILDDLVKGFEEAQSESIRSKTWEWLLQDALTRLEPGGAVIGVGTRWHEDDWIGRAIRAMDSGGQPWRVINLPALAEENDPLGRAAGEALWPERFSVEDLRSIQRETRHRFFGLYQGRPTPPEGEMFKRAWFSGDAIVPVAPRCEHYVRAWDKAATQDDGDYTVGLLMGKAGDMVYVIDVVRGQWGSGPRDNRIDVIANDDYIAHGHKVKTWFEQEPGSGGKQSAEISKRQLTSQGYRVDCEPVTGSKEARADAFASAASLGNVRLVQGRWNAGFVDELCEFPHGTHDDQVDAASMAFNKLCAPKRRILVA